MHLSLLSAPAPLSSSLMGLALSLATLAGCQERASQPAPEARPAESAAPSEAPSEAKALTIEDRAKALLTEAWSHEPKVTALLTELSAAHGGRMVGLEYRLKTEGSTIRKLKKISAEQPQLSIKELTIYDALRYTIEVADQPKGHHVKTIQAVLKRLEGEGFKVKVVKNYWPKGDNYSGVNSVLATAQGFEWELQFHTPESVSESRRSHKEYEELRAQGTSLQRKQELFKVMSAPWESIPTPAQILEPKNLHAQEQIKSLPPPSAKP